MVNNTNLSPNLKAGNVNVRNSSTPKKRSSSDYFGLPSAHEPSISIILVSESRSSISESVRLSGLLPNELLNTALPVEKSSNLNQWPSRGKISKVYTIFKYIPYRILGASNVRTIPGCMKIMCLEHVILNAQKFMLHSRAQNNYVLCVMCL